MKRKKEMTLTVEKVDVVLLRKQRNELLRLVRHAEIDGGPQVELLDGLINMLDHMLGQAFDAGVIK